LAARQAQNAGMRERGRSSLAIPSRTVGVAWVGAVAALLLVATPTGRAEEITIYRCQDAAGRVTLQDEPCAAGQSGTARSMTRPQDPPPRPARARPPVAAADEPPAVDDFPQPAWSPPPPPMFECTDFDGGVRFSEDYAPNTRCVPIGVLGYDLRGSSDAAATCRWVQESCLRVDDATACTQFRAQLKQAESDALHAFSDTAPYRKSEAERLRRIVAESCN
jgi:hypothetical protein